MPMLKELIEEREASAERLVANLREDWEALTRLRREIDALRRMATVLSGLVDAPKDAWRRSMEREDMVVEAGGKTVIAQVKSPKAPRAGSTVAAAVQILEIANHPMHVDELVQRLTDAGLEVRKVPLAASLAKFAARGQHVQRTEGRPNTFGLLERATQTGSMSKTKSRPRRR